MVVIFGGEQPEVPCVYEEFWPVL